MRPFLEHYGEMLVVTAIVVGGLVAALVLRVIDLRDARKELQRRRAIDRLTLVP